MSNHHCSFVRFRAIPSASVAAKMECEGSNANVTSFANATYQAEPIRVLQSSFDMDIDGPTTIQMQHKKRGLEKMTYLETTRKRVRTTGAHWPKPISSHHVDHTSSQLQALSIDLIVSHIIGYLPWKQQIVSCSRVSKLWNQAFLTAPMRVLLFPKKDDEQSKPPLPRVLEPCHIEQCLNEMSWKMFGKMTNPKIWSKITRLDIWGDLDWFEPYTKNHQSQHLSNLCHMEELCLRYMSLDTLLHIFPESKQRRFVHLTKLVIKEWGSKKTQNFGEEESKNRDMLGRRILFHAPNLLILNASV